MSVGTRCTLHLPVSKHIRKTVSSALNSLKGDPTYYYDTRPQKEIEPEV